MKHSGHARRLRRSIALVASLLFVGLGSIPARATSDAPTTSGLHGAVATDQRLATSEGIRVLLSGGNAVDAAVAIGYTLAVTYPAAGNIGGGGFMLVHLADGSSHFIDFREKAPGAASSRMYLDSHGDVVPDESTVGALSAGVPGTVAGLEYARRHFGTRSRAQLMNAAIGYADHGFALNAADAKVIAGSAVLLRRFATSARIFLRGGSAPAAGFMLRQPQLASTLRAVEQHGAAGFYRGEVAAQLVGASRAAGGIMTLDDLARYHAVERTPIVCRDRGDEIVTSPPPSSGGIAICEVLGILGDGRRDRFRSAAEAHREIEAERIAFADRNTEEGDPDFIKVPVARLLSGRYWAAARASIHPDRATPSASLHRPAPVGTEGADTTNYSVVDSAGDAVDVTYTLNNSFGSGFVAGSTGVLLNDEMDDFTSKPGSPNMFGLVQGRANTIAPYKRPLSSMSPTIVLDRTGRTILAVGAAGGPRIITATLDIVRAVVEFGWSAGKAVGAGRLHMQWLPDVVYAERKTFAATTLRKLRSMGYRITLRPAGSVANATAVTSKGERVAAHDPRNSTGNPLAY